MEIFLYVSIIGANHRGSSFESFAETVQLTSGFTLDASNIALPDLDAEYLSWQVSWAFSDFVKLPWSTYPAQINVGTVSNLRKGRRRISTFNLPHDFPCVSGVVAPYLLNLELGLRIENQRAFLSPVIYFCLLPTMTFSDHQKILWRSNR